MFNLFAEGFRFLAGVGLGVDADDGLGVRLAKMHPRVGKVDFHAVDGGEPFVGEFLFYAFEDGVNAMSGVSSTFVLAI